MGEISWDKIAKDYHNYIEKTGDLYQRTYINPVLLEFFGNVKNKRILDLACGQGYFSRILAKKGAKVIGIDASKELLNIAKKIELKKPFGIKYFLKNAAKLTNIKTSSIDLILSNMSFHDIKNIKSTIKECARVLKSKGKLIFSIPHPLAIMAKRERDKEGYFNKMRKYKSIIEIPHPIYGKRGIKSYYRPIGFYLQELFNAGFLLSDFKEISIKHSKDELEKDKVKLKYKQEFPMFLIIGAIKKYK